VSSWYEYSLRALLPDGRWYEIARCKSRESAYQILRALAKSDPTHFVIVHCTLAGKDGREKAVYCFPGSEQQILSERQARLAGKRL
jgi:acyl transferase domain-containing protein